MIRAHGHGALAALALLCACGGDRSLQDAGAVTDAAAEPDAPEEELDAGAAQEPDAASAQHDAGFVAPWPTFPKTAPSAPFLLSELGLYTDMAHKTLAPDLHPYTPEHPLWSDGAEKTRYLRLPPDAQIDTSDMDHWRFPVGTVLFKEFAVDGRALETRVIARTGPGDRDYFMGAFVWRADGSDAELAWDGARDVGGTDHDVPTHTQCGTCHNGEPGRVLGVSAVQTPRVFHDLLSVPPAEPYSVPGDEAAARALSVLHGNCAHCHNPSGSARPDTDLQLRLAVGERSLEETALYRSTVGVRLQYFDDAPLTLRIAPGEPDESGVYYRMSQRGPRTQMPPLGTEHVDARGLEAVGAFIRALGAQ